MLVVIPINSTHAVCYTIGSSRSHTLYPMKTLPTEPPSRFQNGPGERLFDTQAGTASASKSKKSSDVAYASLLLGSPRVRLPSSLAIGPSSFAFLTILYIVSTNLIPSDAEI
jgi:hypothetical protein